MTGSVLLTQGRNAIAGERLVLDLKAGTGVMEGRVKTVFTPGSAATGQGN
jgi:lipopolysaccharide export system protein LptA